MSGAEESRGEDWSAFLDPGERVLWQGRPSSALFLLSRRDVFLIPFSIVWAGFAIPASLQILAQGRGFPALPIGLLFLGVGIYILIGRFFVDWFTRRRTLFTVTNKRAFISKFAFGRSLDSLPITPELPVALKPGPTGSITLGTGHTSDRTVRKIAAWTGDDGSFTFRKITGAQDVYALIRRVQRGEA